VFAVPEHSTSQRCTFTFTVGRALNMAGHNFPGKLQVSMLYFAAEYYTFYTSKMLLMVLWN